MDCRPGMGLLEAVLAMSILAIAMVTVLVGTRHAIGSVEQALRRGAEIEAANGFLDAVALWPPEDLQRRLGWRRQGQMLLHIGLLGVDLYRVELADSSGGILLGTTLYRPLRRDP